MLAAHKVDPRTRQAQLRHTDPRLTEGTYFDHEVFLAPQAEQIQRVPAIPTLGGGSIPATVVPVEGLQRAQLAHETRDSEGHFESSDGTEEAAELMADDEASAQEKCTDLPGNVTKRHDPAPSGTGSFQERVIGVEPTTFTLAT